MSKSSISMSLLLLAVAAGFAPICQAFTVSGTVTDPVSAPVQNVDVFLYDNLGNPIGIPQTRTDNNGLYSILSIPAGTYGLEFVPPTSTGLVTKFIGGVVVSGNTTVNAQLELGYSISGFVRDTTGAGIPNIDLNVYLQATGTLITTPGDNTDATGHYQILVGPGTYRIRWRSTLVGQRWVPVEQENVVITGNTSIDVTMVSGYFLSGTVRNQALTPIANVDLDIIRSSTGVTLITPNDNTDLAGFYQLLIPGGTFNIQVEPLVTDKLVAKESLSVVISSDKTINFTLQPGFLLSGTVSSTARAGVAGVDINVNYSAGGVKVFTPTDKTDATGLYNLIVPSGVFDLAYRPPVATHKAPLVRTSVPITKDTVVNVTVPNGILLTSTVTGPGGSVAGVDLDAVQLPAGTKVYLFDDVTSVSGSVSVVLVPGLYQLEYEPPIALKLVAKRFSNMSLTTDTNLPVTLSAGFVISGTARDSNNTLLSGVNVDAIDASTSDTVFTPGDSSSSAGFYDIVVPGDTYHLLYRPRAGSGITDSVFLQNVAISKDTTINVKFITAGSGCACGDANGNGIINIADVVFVIAYIFSGGSAPNPLCRGDANGNVIVNIADVVYLIAFIFAGGPTPHCL